MDAEQWRGLCDDCETIHAELQGLTDGNVASYIPQLARTDPAQFRVSIVTTEGLAHHIGGDPGQPQPRVCVQSCCKPLLYGMALNEHGTDAVGRHVGREPSGSTFNDFRFDSDGKPFNPLINAGAIMSASLIGNGLNGDERFARVLDMWKRMVGPSEVSFDNLTYLGELRTAYRNVALAHLMMENDVFPENTDIMRTLQLYLQACSIEVTPAGMATYAAMFANGGRVPRGGSHIFTPAVIRDILCVMYSSGMYDYSGRWSSEIGLPAKSGVSGYVMVVIPNICGICIFSPRLDAMGNSVRGVAFMRRLVQKYRLHIFDTLVRGLEQKKCLHAGSASGTSYERLFTACVRDDAEQLQALLDEGYDPAKGDYDRRTPLHIAVDEGARRCIPLLLARGSEPLARDRWNNSALRLAVERGDREIVACFVAHLSFRKVGRRVWRALAVTPPPPHLILSSNSPQSSTSSTSSRGSARGTAFSPPAPPVLGQDPPLDSLRVAAL